ncbi:MAG TPA: hypothetical protein V6D17_14660 [Candidatus Obscuribacterales bacterium]
MKFLLVALWIALSVLSVSAYAQSSADSDAIPFNTEKYEENADWILALKVRTIKDYLQFNRSPFYPVACVTVTSQLRQESNGAWKDKRNYETLWYHHGAPLGLRRHEVLSLPKDSHGIIKVERSPDAAQNTKALVNAVLRLLPDVHLMKAVPLVVVVPHELCRPAETDLSAFRFFRAKKITGDATTMLLHMVSDRPGFDRYFYYTTKYGEILD